MTAWVLAGILLFSSLGEQVFATEPQNTEDTGSSEILEGTGSPEASEEPEGSGSPETLEEPEDSGSTTVPEASEESEGSGSTTVPEVSEEPGSPEDPEKTESAEVSGQPNSPETPEEPEKKLIVSWSWVDEEELLTWNEELSRYELDLPGVSKDSPISGEELLDMLPQEITAVLKPESGTEKNGEAQDLEKKEENEAKELRIPLKWDSSALPETVEGGEYCLTAETDFSGESESYAFSEDAQELAVWVEAGGAETLELSDHVIDTGVSPSEITINLFDYWLNPDDRWAPDSSYNDTSRGFNSVNQPLKFSNLVTTWSTNINKATSSSYVNKGIVRNTLSYSFQGPGLPMFNGEYNNGVENPYEWIIDMMPLVAHFGVDDEQEGKKAYADVKNLLQVDEKGYYYYDSQKNFAEFNEDANGFFLYDAPGVVSGYGGQFFPFNRGDEIFKEENGKLVNKDTLMGGSPQMTDFIHHFHGLTMETAFYQPEGGIYKGEDMTYSFSGDDDVWVFIDGVLVGDVGGMHAPTNLNINFKTGEVHVWGTFYDGIYPATDYHTTIKKAFQDAGRYTASAFNGNTFADNTSHVLQFFYLERGHDAANLSLKFNLALQKENTIQKQDAEGIPMQGIGYELYVSDAAWQTKGETVFSGTTDENGELFIEKDSEAGWTLKELRAKSEYYVLKETSVPDGYRAQEIHLRLAGAQENPYWLVENSWETGAMAENVQKVMTPLVGNSTVKMWLKKGYANLGAFVKNKETGKLLYRDTGGVWRETSDWEEAYRQDPSVSSLNSAAFFVNEVMMPPDYGANPNKYELAFWQIKDTDTTLEGITYFPDSKQEKQFKGNLLLTNVCNTFTVEKVNEEGEPLKDAEFTLYEEGKDTPYDTGVTDAQGRLSFGLQGTSTGKKPLVQGQRYIVRETKAPGGYLPNETETAVAVDGTGIYIDAGTDGDGVKAKLSIGKPLASTESLAGENAADMSLYAVEGNLQTAKAYEGEQTAWSDEASGKSVCYRYETGTGYTPAEYLEGDSGFIKLHLYQCAASGHGNAEYRKRRQELGDQELNGCFAVDTVLEITDQKKATLTVEKEVVNPEGSVDESKEFTFEFQGTLSSGESRIISGTYTKGGRKGQTLSLTLNESSGGKASFTLRHGEAAAFEMSVGMPYRIEEEKPENYIVQLFDAEGKQIASGIMENEQGLAPGEEDYGRFVNTYSVTALFKFRKTGEDGKPLAGAKFAVYQKQCQDSGHDHSQELLKVDKTNGDLTDSAQQACWTRYVKNGETGTYISGTDGVVSMELPMGYEYRLAEYSAPEPYVTPGGQWVLTYDSGAAAFRVTGSVGNPPAFEALGTDADVPYEVRNYIFRELPVTGGAGVMALRGAGVAAMIAAWERFRRRKKR